MKSIMEEASSISKAIETAWNRAGQPAEFTVKILELPQTSFFGLKTSKSAKIAFLFNEATTSVKAKDHSSQQRQSQQRPVALRQTGNRNEQDPRRRSDSQKNNYQERTERPEGGTREDRRDRGENREPREHREQRDQRHERDRGPRSGSSEGWKRTQQAEGMDKSDYAKASSDRRQERSEYGQRPDKSDYAKSGAYPAGSAEASGEGWKRAQRAEGTDRREDRRPRFSENERSEHGYSQERDSWTPEMAQIAQEWIKETLVLMGKPDISVSTRVSQNYLNINLSSSVTDDARQEETQLKSWGMLAMEAVREKMGKPLRALRIVLESPRK